MAQGYFFLLKTDSLKAGDTNLVRYMRKSIVKEFVIARLQCMMFKEDFLFMMNENVYLRMMKNCKMYKMYSLIFL